MWTVWFTQFFLYFKIYFFRAIAKKVMCDQWQLVLGNNGDAENFKIYVSILYSVNTGLRSMSVQFKFILKLSLFSLQMFIRCIISRN